MKINAFERNKGKKIQENYNWQFQDKMLTMMMWLLLWSNEIRSKSDLVKTLFQV